MKRILTIQDISCVGRCSLTVALPVISAMGVECAVLPTAVLSNHTLFKNFTCKDLSGEIHPIMDVWEKEGITFDGIYTGYLASADQCRQICGLFDRFAGKDTLVLADPAMADNGKLYAGFDDSFPAEMAKVCAKADIILPNITEACLMTGMKYRTEYDESYISEMLERLLKLGCKTAVVTGVSFSPELLGAAYLTHGGNPSYVFTRRCSQCYHGTGDLYASAVMGGIMRGMELNSALELAGEFTASCIEATASSTTPRWYGVEFESQIGNLTQMVQKRI